MRDRRGDFSFLPATRTLDYSKGQLESRLLAKEIVPLCFELSGEGDPVFSAAAIGDARGARMAEAVVAVEFPADGRSNRDACCICRIQLRRGSE
jgi:hypothetical protein